MARSTAVNSMASNLTSQVRNIADVTKAVAGGDLSKKITVDVKGEILELKNTINTMVDQLNAFASEVTRVAREVGTEGVLGGQADVRGVGGTRDVPDDHLVHELLVDAGPRHDLLHHEGSEAVGGHVLERRSGLGVGCPEPVDDDNIVHKILYGR